MLAELLRWIERVVDIQLDLAEHELERLYEHKGLHWSDLVKVGLIYSLCLSFAVAYVRN